MSEWIARRPAWLEVERITTPPDPNLRWLGEGECEAIMLAEQHGQDVFCSWTKAGGAGKLSGVTFASLAHWVF